MGDLLGAHTIYAAGCWMECISDSRYIANTFRELTPMPMFEVHYEQDKQIHKELVEAESAEGAWKEFVLRTKEQAKPGENKQVMCVIRHELD
ncbi:MAG: hypothetical protein RBR02_02460 [Desulfuromonadaceae bacterium]|nr:hypothetical protein [Desulfuromonadaceae bacterium]